MRYNTRALFRKRTCPPRAAGAQVPLSKRRVEKLFGLQPIEDADKTAAPCWWQGAAFVEWTLRRRKL